MNEPEVIINCIISEEETIIANVFSEPETIINCNVINEETVIETTIKEETIECSLKEESINVEFTDPIGITPENIYELLRTWTVFEDLTPQINGTRTIFNTTDKIYGNSLKVWINGLKQRGLTKLTDTSFEVELPALVTGDSLECEYIKDI